jgi:energy-coupling factor transporter ATP-binding protein EcfA2
MSVFTPIINKRVKEQSTPVQIGNENFTIHERHIPGNDDPIYEKNRNIWEEIPRGDARITLNGNIVGTLVGVRKFGYKDSSYGYSSQVTKVIAIDKENGECAHATSFKIKDQIYWIVGSKHVNVIFRKENYVEDLKKFEGKYRYGVALKIANLFVSILQNMTAQKYGYFAEFLAINKLTANGEIIFSDSQHIVDYNGVNEIRWFALSFDGKSDEGLCLAPSIAKNFFEYCELKFATMSDIIMYKNEDKSDFSDEYKNLVNSVAQRINSEGVVMYGLNDTNHVVCMWKEKSYPYVMERIVREAIMRGMCGDELYQYIQTRLSTQPQNLRQYFASWEEVRVPFLIQFAAFLQNDPVFVKMMEKKDKNQLWSIRSQWITLQAKCASLPIEKKTEYENICKTKTLSGVSSIQTIMMVGPPGSGKSTLSRALMEMLKKCGKSPIWLNQDEAGGNKKKYIDAIKNAISFKKPTHIILDKSNLDPNNRKDYEQLELTPTVTVIFQHPDGDDELVNLCVNRIMSRGQAHRSLKPSEELTQTKITEIITNFMTMANIDDLTSDVSSLFIDATRPLNETVKLVWNSLRQANTSLLPEFENLPSTESINIATEYERYLERYGSQQQLYACIKIRNPQVFLASIPMDAIFKKDVKDEFHITIKYFGGVIDPEWFVDHARKIGQIIPLHITSLVFDDFGAALVIEKTFPCANEHPHITLATAKGIKPVYSNELLQKTSDVSVVKVDFVVEGEYVFM